MTIMGKGPLLFKKTDVTRALLAAKKAGVDVRVELDLERKRMTLTPVKPDAWNGKTENEWDEVLPNGEAT
jgi:hypothetical protein